MKSPTNTELLNMSDPEAKLLTGIERQRRFVMRIQARQMPCPNCGTGQSVFEAAGIKLDDYDFGVSEHKYTCINVTCRRELEHCVPLIAIHHAWLWMLVPICVTGPAVQIIEYSLCGAVLKTEPMMFKRLYAVGQSLRMDYRDYEVTSVEVVNGVQKVCLKSCEVCARCGGTKGKEGQFGCACR